MIKLLSILILFVFIFASGCTSQEKITETKYVSENSDQRYVTFSSDGTAFYHTGDAENYKGTWKEVDGQNGEREITFFLDDGSSLVFRKKSEDMILLKVAVEGNNGGVVRYYLDR